MFPVHLYNNHWCLISVSFDDHKLILCNLLLSHGHDETKCMDAIQAYLMIEQKKTILKSWVKEICRTPQHDNFNDCGIFVCMNGRNIAEQSCYKFYLDVPHSRRHIKHELLNC